MNPGQQRRTKTAQAAIVQRRAVAPAASVWVAASAGTGKTKVLTDRVLSLLLHGTAPARLLCLTFTKAAAAEMSNRLSDRLARWSVAEDAELAGSLESLLGEAPDEATLATARQLFARVLDTPGRLKIQTIHAFCQSLLGRFPLEAGIAPHFRVLDERVAAELLDKARLDVLGRLSGAADDVLAAAVARVAALADEGSFLGLLGELLSSRARLAHLLEAHGDLDGVVAATRHALGCRPGERVADILAAATADVAFDLMGLKLTAEAMCEGSAKDSAHGAIIADWLAATPAERSARFDDYLAAFFTAGGSGDPYKTLIHKQALAAAPGADQILDGEAQRLAAVRDRLQALAVAEGTAALLRLGHAILQRYQQLKALGGRLDYDDLILKTRDLLQQEGIAAWVLYKLDGGLDHILIDEAQDTNPEQWQVIQALSEEFFTGSGARESPRTVFAVGDAKQSIYSFQRADPRAFTAMRSHFQQRAGTAGQGWDGVDLSASFRSTAAVLQAVDAVFAEPMARDGVALEDLAVRHDPVRVGQAGLVELWPPAEPLPRNDPEPWAAPQADRGSAPAHSRLAQLIARRIHRWTRDPAAAGAPESQLASQGRRLRPGDFLVLVRRRNAFFEELVRALKQRGVPVAGVDRMVLTEQLAVMDLIALGRVLLLPEDDLTLATVLKGPLIGLSEEQLFALAHGRPDRLWHSLAAKTQEDPAFAVAHATLSDLRAKADFQRPYELYAHLLGAGGGRRRLLAALGPEARDAIEEFLAQALAFEREQAPSLEGFLHWLAAVDQEIARDMEHGGDAVRVMTVHGAKGLQAPVVFLPDTLQVPPTSDGLFWSEEAESFVVWRVPKTRDAPATAALRAAALVNQQQEYRRLLYVAMTRAEDRLYICGWNTQRRAPDDCWYRLVEQALSKVAEPVAFDFSADIGQGWAGPGWRLASAQAAVPEAQGEPLGPGPLPETLPGWALRPPAPEPLPPRPLAPSRPAADEPAVLSPLAGGDTARFKRGRILHRLLQSLPDLPPGQRTAAGRRFLSSPLHGLDPGQQAAVLDETMTVLEQPEFAALFGPDSRAEVPLSGVVEGKAGPQVVSGQVDRLVVRPDAVLVVDYKTHRPAPQQAQAVPAIYLRQMAVYRAILRAIYPGRQVESFLLWTEGPRVMQLGDALLDDHAP